MSKLQSNHFVNYPQITCELVANPTLGTTYLDGYEASGYLTVPTTRSMWVKFEYNRL